MKQVHIIDSHTGGEPTRVVIKGFPQLAGRIDAEVAAGYARSFDRLAAAAPAGDAPSAATLGALQAYAVQRAEAARTLSDGLRRGDAQALDAALRPASAPLLPRR